MRQHSKPGSLRANYGLRVHYDRDALSRRWFQSTALLSRSADSLVREFFAEITDCADKAVRAPLVAAQQPVQLARMWVEVPPVELGGSRPQARTPVPPRGEQGK